MYPTDHCPICNDCLKFDEVEKCYECIKDAEHYAIWDDGVISIKIENYLFEFYPKDYYSHERMRVWDSEYSPCIYEYDSHIYVDKSNYLKVLDRLKNLQAFK